jgi:hypothetical protein
MSLRRRLRPLSRALRRSLRPPDYRRLLKRVDDLERNLAHLLRLRFPGLGAEASAAELLRAQEWKVHSQNGEDGLIAHVFSTIGPTDRRFVEIGIGDGSECNTANLTLHFGWGGLLVDCVTENVASARRFYHEEHGVPLARLAIAEARVDAENVNALLDRHGVRGSIDLLSIDIDSNDYWVWKAIDRIKPRVVVIEYNASFGPSEPWIALYEPSFDSRAHHPSGWYHGASLTALARLGARRGYQLVGCDSAGVNAFFVRRELAASKLPAQDPAEAFHPHRRRLRHASAEAQIEALRSLPFATDPD